jgi:hypothetical protein
MLSMQDIDKLFSDLASKDDKIRYNAFKTLLDITENKVPWAYDKWFILIEKLSSENSYQRSIGFMLLANLSKSDEDNKVADIINDLLKFTDDEKFITSRQCIQNLWKFAINHTSVEQKIVKHLINTYIENIHLKSHGNLIKQDVVFSLWNIYKSSKNKDILKVINELIESETDEKLMKSLKKVIQK